MTQPDAIPFIQRHGRRLAVLYSLLVLPTMLLLWFTGGDDSDVSRWFTEVWHADGWRFPGLSDTASLILADGFLFAVIALAGAAFFLGYRTLSNLNPDEETERRLSRELIRWTGIFGLVLIFVIPFHSQDLLGYINRGVEQVFYGVNPYLVTVGDLSRWQDNPMFHEHWIFNPSPYGFFFTWLTGVFVRLGGGHFMATALVFKLLALATYLGLTVVIYRLAQSLEVKRPWLTLYLTGWNPLLLLHLVANGHNDGLLLLLLLAALWLLAAGRFLWLAWPVLALSIFTKYASLLAAPFLVVWFIRQQHWRSLLAGLIVAAALTGLLALPFIPSDPGAVPVDQMAGNAGISQHSLHSMLSRTVYYLGVVFAGTEAWLDPARKVFKYILWGLYVLFYAGFWLYFIRQRPEKPEEENRRLLWAIAIAMTVMITLASSKFHAWYAGMFLPLLFLLPEGSFWRRFGLYFTGFQLLAFTPLENIHVINALLLVLAPYLLAYRNYRQHPEGC